MIAVRVALPKLFSEPIFDITIGRDQNTDLSVHLFHTILLWGGHNILSFKKRKGSYFHEIFSYIDNS